MAMNRKGIFFTFTSLVLVTVLMLSISMDTKYRLREESLAAGDRVRAIDFFVSDLEKDVERGAYIAMFRALLGVQQHITSEGQFLNDTQATFRELLVNGTINSTYVSVMNQTELNVWLAKIQGQSRKIALIMEYRINDLMIYQDNPWVVNTRLNITFNVTDIRGIATFSRESIIVSSVNITGFEDPLYSVNTYGRIIRTVKKTNITAFTSATNASGLRYHVDNGFYRESTSAPSFIMRLSGNLSNSSMGIESFVNLKHFENAMLPIMNKTCMDYLYFSNASPTSFRINHTYNWLRIDNQSHHLLEYNVSHLIIW
jgi:hypothetical protein